MNEFETRLTEALTSGAEQAPDPDGLVAGARRRSRTRRRNRVAVGVGVVVAVLAVPVGVLALGGGGTPDQTIADDPADRKKAVWQTVEHEGVLVDIPGDWVRWDTSACVTEDTRYGPRGADPCTFDHDGVGFYTSADIDPYRGPGVFEDPQAGWTGYATIGDWFVNVHSEDRDRARRILGSSREEGQKNPDLSAGWRTVSYEGVFVDVPATWQDGALSTWCVDESVPGWVDYPGVPAADVDCPPPANGYGIRFAGGGSEVEIRQRGGPQYPDGSWAGVAITPRPGGSPVAVEVVAPNQGLAELIGGSLRAE